MKKMKALIFLLVALLFLIGCGKTINKEYLKDMLFDSSGDTAYEIDGINQGIDSMDQEYQYFINLNFPSHLKSVAKSSKKTWMEFIQRREKQDMIIVDALKTEVFDDPVFNYFLKQGLRDAIVKAYLYKKIPNINKLKDAHFTDDRLFLEEIYKKNKELYDKKKIPKEAALQALRKVYLKKKKAIIDYLLQNEERKVINELQKKFKINENTEVLSQYPKAKPEEKKEQKK